ncbi:hypothetical protein Dip510_000359 [Elusimicrobium posterum]|uniref:hypothetical protein n=1 Tax=Elusimicrobium posterum TaxID=3116653 RepID=UPI003C70FB43
MKKIIVMFLAIVLMSNTLFPPMLFAENNMTGIMKNLNTQIAFLEEGLIEVFYGNDFHNNAEMSDKAIQELKGSMRMKGVEYNIKNIQRIVNQIKATEGGWELASESEVKYYEDSNYKRYLRDYILREGKKGTLKIDFKTIMGPEAIAVLSNNEGIITYNKFTARLSEFYKGTGNYHSTDALKSMLDSKRMGILAEKLFPKASGAELENLTKLTRAYIDYSHQRAYIEMEVEVQFLSDSRATTKNNFLERKDIKAALKKYKEAKAKFKSVYNLEATQKALDKALLDEFRIAQRSPSGNQYYSDRVKKSVTSKWLRNMKTSALNIGVLVGFVGLGLVMEGIAGNMQDKETKATLNNLTAAAIKDKATVVAAIKENPYIIPVISQKQRNEFIDRQDVLSEDQKLQAVIGYLAFYNDVENNPDKYRKIIKDMEAQDNQLAYFESQDSASQQKTLAFENAKKNVKAPQEVLNFSI